MTPTIHHDISATQYHSDPHPDGPSLSSSIAKLLVSATPAHAFLAHPRLTPRTASEPEDETPSQARGTLTHALVLGKGADIVEVDAKDWRTDAAKAKRDNARTDGKIPVLKSKLSEAQATATAIRSRLADLGYHLAGYSEVVVLFTLHSADGTPIPCRMMVDHLGLGEIPTFALDLKTLESAAPDSCQRQANQYGHALQRAFYCAGLAALYGDRAPPFAFAFAETDPPHAVTIADADGSARELGEMQLARALNMWARCMREGHWPAKYGDGRTSLRAMPWDMTTEMGYLL